MILFYISNNSSSYYIDPSCPFFIRNYLDAHQPIPIYYIICLLAEHINLMCVLSESTCRNLCLGQENPDLHRIVHPL